MTSFTFLVPDADAAQFDRIAEGHGGRSALLRRLIGAVVHGEAMSEGAVAPREGRADQRLEILVTKGEATAVEALAAQRGMKRSAWLVNLVRRRLHRSPEPAPPEAKSLEAIRSELRRIEVNINQIAQAPGQGGSGDLGRLEALVVEIRASIAAVGAARRGDLSYWEVAE
ncbi:plasmid mobilization protein [Rhizorhabdus argentea]|uniref:plasmid mobilization protein n=1 Tax=Rhizorhabdus argentea TaxID=1387174 RepID=UPI0030ED9B41